MIDTESDNSGSKAACRLAEANCCEIAPGLSKEEFTRIEAAFGIRFSPDHRAFLAAGLPVAAPPEDGATWEQPWPDWRHGDPDDLRRRLAWPVDGVLRAVENGWWYSGWGERPECRKRAMRAARRELAGVPQLVPLYGHRFLPAGPAPAGRPVLSVWGVDIICYGEDLADWVERDFTRPEWATSPRPQATVAFWGTFLV